MFFTEKEKNKVFAIICLVGGILFWAGNSVAGRLSVGMVPPVSLAFWRWVGAFCILLPFGWYQLRGQGALIWQYRYM